jgi:hypothetical protein
MVTFNNHGDDLIATEVDVSLRLRRQHFSVGSVARRLPFIDWKLYALAGYLDARDICSITRDFEGETLIAPLDLGCQATMTLTDNHEDIDVHISTFQPTLDSTDSLFPDRRGLRKNRDWLVVKLQVTYRKRYPFNYCCQFCYRIWFPSGRIHFTCDNAVSSSVACSAIFD